MAKTNTYLLFFSFIVFLFYVISCDFVNHFDIFKDIYGSPCAIPFGDVDPDVCKNVTQLITSKGYPCEEYTVQTVDGFRLGIQRIPHGVLPHKDKNTEKSSKPVVFLQHGLLCAATNWVSNLANESLGFLLADAGFDVWLGNSRGNTYSRNHVHLSPSQNEFWSWSWDEMAKYDLSAVVDYILQKTGNKQIFYIGHSQGTLIAFAGFSQNQTLASKIKLFVALAPVAYLGHVKSPIKAMSLIPDELAFTLLGRRDFLPSDWIIKLLGSTVCRDKITSPVCSNLLFLLAGYDIHNLNVSRVPVYVSNCPAGTSVQDILHFSQMLRRDKFQAFDYGSADLNKQHYNQSTAPLYDLSKMTVPTVAYWGTEDWLAAPEDVARLLGKLTNLKESHRIESWNHLDFIWGVNAADVLYYNIIKTLRNYVD